MSNRYEYTAYYCESGIRHIVCDKEATGIWNAWEFDSEDEALAFLTEKTVVKIEGFRH